MGTVVDPLGGVITGAAVTLTGETGSPRATKTDARGRFTFDDVTPGRYWIDATAPGFSDRVLDPFFVGAGARVSQDVALQIGVRQDVVVTASGSELPASEVGAPVTVIDRDALDKLEDPDVLSSLRSVPGVSVVQIGPRGAATSLFVRGGASNFSKVLVDGIPANDIGGAFSFADVATAGVDRVEVLRDANSVVYGSDALAGVVSLTTRRGETHTPEATYDIDGGNLGTLRQEGSFGGVAGRVDYFVDTAHLSTNNNAPNSQYDATSYSGRLGALVGRTEISATLRRTASTVGLPNAIALFGVPDDSSQTSDNTFGGVTVNTSLSDRWQNVARVGVTTLRSRTVNPTPTGQPFDPFGFGANYLGNVVTVTGANGDSVTGQAVLDFSGTYPSVFVSETNRQSFVDQTTFRVSNVLELSSGARVDHEDGFTDSGTRDESTRTNAGAFGEARISVSRVFASAGVGLDHNAIFGFAATPRVSVAAYLRSPSSTAGIGGTKLTFNAGTGIKAPTIGQELSSVYALLQSASVAVPSGISPIGPERSRSLDVGVEQSFWGERARVGAAFFDNQFSNLIEFVDSSVLPQLGIPPAVAAATDFGAYVNSSSYWARGLETSVDVRVARAWRVSASYTYLDARVTKSLSDGALEPAINPAFPTIPIGAFAPLVGARPFRRPVNSGNVTASYTHGQMDAAVSATFAGKSDDSTFLEDAFFGNSMLLPNADLDPAYALINATVAWRVDRRIRTYVAIENLGNDHYQPAFGFAALPRTVRVGVTVTAGGAR